MLGSPWEFFNRATACTFISPCFYVLDLTQLLLARLFFEESENPKAVI